MPLHAGRVFPSCPLVDLTRFWCAFIDLFAGATQVGIIKCQHTPFSISRQILGLPCLLDSGLSAGLADNSCSQSKWPSWHTLEFVCYNLKLSTMAAAAAAACWPGADQLQRRIVKVSDGYECRRVGLASQCLPARNCQRSTGYQLAHVPHDVCLITNKGKQRVGRS